jgi:tetratricopeptide (TPR) repeat protein
MTRRRTASALALAALLATGGGSAHVAQAQDAAAALRAGDYPAALALLQRQARLAPRAAATHRALARTLAEVGRLQEAEDVARAFTAASPRSVELLDTLGRTLAARGRNADAEAAFKKAIAGGAADALVAEVDLAVLRLDRGERDEAMKGFGRLVDAYNQGRLTSEQLTAVGTACRYLGADDPQLFKDALKAFDEAIEADADNLDARVALAELFLEKYNGPDADATVKEALERNPSHPRALLARARVMDFAGQPGVVEAIRRSLAINPTLAEAHVFLAEVLLEQEDLDAAGREAEAVLAQNAASLPALSALAAARFLQGDPPHFEEARQRALALNPHNGELYNRLAEMSARNRLFTQAVAFAQQAVALDARSWRGWGILGLNQLRVGAIDEGRKNLEVSFKGDPYNVWIKNTLDLLDTFPKYEETASAHFRIFIHGKEAALLSPYASDLAEEAYAKLSERYRYRPEGPVRIEIYPDHADFSVRTVGLAGLAGLGACFGPVMAMDSPSAREVGKFNWGSTLWHEVAHTFTLGASRQKVPRWFTEGLSVHEEHRAREGWGDDATLEFLRALKAGALLPLRDLNSGFVRPTNPEQVGISYYQASLVVDWIEEKRGFPAVLDLLAAYADGRTTEEAFRKVLGTSLEDFDRVFLAYANERFAGPLAAVTAAPIKVGSLTITRPVIDVDPEKRAKDATADFEAQRMAGMALFHQKKLAEALPYFERARALFPDYPGEDSPSWFLALIYKEQGKRRQAIDELARLVSTNDSHYRGHLELATLREAEGDLAGAAAALDRALYISPFEPAVHERLASLYARLGDRAGVVRARRSLVALDPVDRPEALYQLALALQDAGDAAGARREVLRALELAPRFQRAQELLLRLHDARTGGTS